MTHKKLGNENCNPKSELFCFNTETKSPEQSAAKHYKTHVAIIECTHFILRRHAFAETARIIFNKCRIILEAQAGFVALLDKSRRDMDILHLEQGGLPGPACYDSPFPARGLRLEALKNRRPVLCNNFRESKWAKLLPEGHASLHNVLLSPMVIENISVGLLGFANKPTDFDHDDMLIALSFAKLAALSLSGSKAWHLLQGKTGRDKIT